MFFLKSNRYLPTIFFSYSNFIFLIFLRIPPSVISATLCFLVFYSRINSSIKSTRNKEVANTSHQYCAGVPDNGHHSGRCLPTNTVACFHQRRAISKLFAPANFFVRAAQRVWTLFGVSLEHHSRWLAKKIIVSGYEIILMQSSDLVTRAVDKIGRIGWNTCMVDCTDSVSLIDSF